MLPAATLPRRRVDRRRLGARGRAGGGLAGRVRAFVDAVLNRGVRVGGRLDADRVQPGWVRSSTARPSGSVRQMRFRAVSAFAMLSVMRSAMSPRVSSALTTLAAAPPRSEPGSGRTLPSSRWAAAERMMVCVSESLVIGWFPCREDRDNPDPATTPSRPSLTV
jgi:hypothetical protein